MMVDTVLRLKKGREKLLNGEWRQLGYTHVMPYSENVFCTTSALIGVVPQPPEELEQLAQALNQLDIAAMTMFPDRIYDPVTPPPDTPLRPAICFNDHPDTTLEDVIELYDEAIRLATNDAIDDWKGALADA